jgi:hypothetical protein
MWNKQNADKWAAEAAATRSKDLVTGSNKFLIDNPFASAAQIAAGITNSGMSKADVSSTLDALVASGKISAADRYYIGQGKGLDDLAKQGMKWLADNPDATQKQIDDVVKAAGLSKSNTELPFAHGYQIADNQMTAAAKYIKENKDVARWLSSDQGKTYVKEHPEFDAADLAWTHFLRYGKDEGRKWGADPITKIVNTNTFTGGGGDNTVYGTGGSGTSGSLESVYGPSLPPGVSGAGITTVNPNGTITTRPNIPGIPEGGFTGMTDLRNAYTKGGGSLGYIPYTPKTIGEFNTKYTNTGGSKAALDYLMGKTAYSATPYTPTGEIQKPYFESVGRAPENRKAKKYVFVNGKYELNPDYVEPSYVLAGRKAAADKAAAAEKPKTEAPADIPAGANGGLMAMAGGGMSGQFNLGGYSDGGRLLRGPGDGVSDSIPATIGNKRPARLADGEFVVPARIVSELGNGSTEAGARKLYAMMDRVQAARKSSIGKGKVAKNSRADKHLPA